MKIRASDIRDKKIELESNRHEPQYGKIVQPLDPKYQSIGRRFLAGLVDATIITVLLIGIEIVLILLNTPDKYAYSQVIISPILILYPVILTKMYGATLGKVYFNIEVISCRSDIESSGITWIQSFLRELINSSSIIGSLALVCIFFFGSEVKNYAEYNSFLQVNPIAQILTYSVSLAFLMEIMTAGASKKRRALHDFLGSTVVLVRGPYRPWSNIIAIGAFGLTLYVQVVLFEILTR